MHYTSEIERSWSRWQLRSSWLWIWQRYSWKASSWHYVSNYPPMTHPGTYLQCLDPIAEMVGEFEFGDNYDTSNMPLACFNYYYGTTSWDGYFFWVPIIVFEVFLCSLLIVRAVRAYRVGGGLCFRMFHITRILIRDSLLYYVAWVQVLVCTIHTNFCRILAAYVSTTIYWVHLATKEVWPFHNRLRGSMD